MTLLESKALCCGCTACESICPKQAITMTPDIDGFFYPAINEDLCIHCNLCEKVCTYKHPSINESMKQTYVAVATDADLIQSSSGALFPSFAQAVIADGGIVYGCAMIFNDNKLHIKHIAIEDIESLNKLKGSKYVQSDLHGIYQNVLHNLNINRTVLFTGTPCQVAGLKSYLRKDYPNLFTIDIVCHGVPSKQLFDQYISFVEKKHKNKISYFNFRDKSNGWKLLGSISFEDGSYITFKPEESSYYQLFLNSYTYRENCYTCPYASSKRPGDITIGDYWCVDLVHPELISENGGDLSQSNGVSSLIVNNDKGRILLNEYGKGIKTWSSTYDNASKYNRQLIQPSSIKKERGLVLKLARSDYKKLERWYRLRLIPIKFKRYVRSLIPKPIKIFIRKRILNSIKN